MKKTKPDLAPSVKLQLVVVLVVVLLGILLGLKESLSYFRKKGIVIVHHPFSRRRPDRAGGEWNKC